MGTPQHHQPPQASGSRMLDSRWEAAEVPAAVTCPGAHLHLAAQACLLGRHGVRCQKPHVKAAAGEAGGLLQVAWAQQRPPGGRSSVSPGREHREEDFSGWQPPPAGGSWQKLFHARCPLAPRMKAKLQNFPELPLTPSSVLTPLLLVTPTKLHPRHPLSLAA